MILVFEHKYIRESTWNIRDESNLFNKLQVQCAEGAPMQLCIMFCIQIRPNVDVNNHGNIYSNMLLLNKFGCGTMYSQQASSYWAAYTAGSKCGREFWNHGCICVMTQVSLSTAERKTFIPQQRQSWLQVPEYQPDLLLGGATTMLSAFQSSGWLTWQAYGASCPWKICANGKVEEQLNLTGLE